MFYITIVSVFISQTRDSTDESLKANGGSGSTNRVALSKSEILTLINESEIEPGMRRVLTDFHPK